MNYHNAVTAINNMQDKRILIVGDLMIDHYIWGNVSRISQEAPVPVVDVRKEEYRLGGASNVAMNIKSMGAIPIVVGVLGDDKYFSEFQTLLWNKGISTEGLFVDSERPTTVKSRVIAHNQQVIRIDFEKTTSISKEIEKKIMSYIKKNIKQIDAVILEDYNKGLLTPNIIKSTIKIALENNKAISVDPKFKNIKYYKGATIFKPNLLELSKSSNVEITSEESFLDAGRKLRNDLSVEYLIVTRSEKGLMIFDKNGETNIPTFAKEVFDVSGAGDTVISLLTLGISVDLNIVDAAIIANHGAGQVCGKIGIHSAFPEDIYNSIEIHK